MITHREGMEMESRLRGQKVAGAGYVMASDGASLRLPLMIGSYVYARGATESDMGSLYRVVEPNDKELADDPDVVVAVEAKLNKAKGANKYSKLPVFDALKKEVRFRPDPRELFTVDHLVNEQAGGATFWRCSFAATTANVEITKMYGRRSDVDEGGWEMLHTPIRKMTEAECIDSGYSPFEPHERAREKEEVEEKEELQDVMRNLQELHVKQSALKTGAEGKIKAPVDRLRGGETEGVRGGGTVQRCQYGSLFCAGCRVNFGLQEEMESHLGGLVHPAQECRDAHAQALAAERDLERFRSNDRVETGSNLVALFTTVKGQSGVYEGGAEVQAMVASALYSEAWVTTKLVKTEQEGLEFLREESVRAAAAALKETEMGVGSEMEYFYYIPKKGVYKGRLHADGIHEVIMACTRNQPELREHVLASRSFEGILRGAKHAQDKLAKAGTPINPGFHWWTDVTFNGPVEHISPWSAELVIGNRVPIIDTERVARLADESLAEAACWPVCAKGSNQSIGVEAARERARGQGLGAEVTGDEPQAIERIPCDYCAHGYRTPGCDFNPPQCDAWVCSEGSPPCPFGMNHSCWCDPNSGVKLAGGVKGSGPATCNIVGEDDEVAGDLLLRREIKGSQTRRTHLAEKLAPARLEKITACIAGRCGVEKSVANATECKGGCGRSLHVETCAQMGKGYAALGNFTCVDCRINDPTNPILKAGSNEGPTFDAAKEH
jgi:hypothetical protein